MMWFFYFTHIYSFMEVYCSNTNPLAFSTVQEEAAALGGSCISFIALFGGERKQLRAF